MRFGEYRDALRLIERYPFLGVGFGAPPDIDLYLAVASTYLTIAGNAGLVGLVMFGITIVSVFYYPYKNYSTISMNDDSLDLTLGLISAIIGAMVGGIFDHFYFNIDFQATSLTLWLCIGWLLVLVRLTRQTAEKSTLMGM
jgi:O-antigen ligase